MVFSGRQKRTWTYIKKATARIGLSIPHSALLFCHIPACKNITAWRKLVCEQHYIGYLTYREKVHRNNPVKGLVNEQTTEISKKHSGNWPRRIEVGCPVEWVLLLAGIECRRRSGRRSSTCPTSSHTLIGSRP